jgi:hypothetical protein
VPYVKYVDMPSAIYEVVIHVHGQVHKYLTVGIGLSPADQEAYAKADARKWANQYDKNAEIETPTVWG